MDEEVNILLKSQESQILDAKAREVMFVQFDTYPNGKYIRNVSKCIRINLNHMTKERWKETKFQMASQLVLSVITARVSLCYLCSSVYLIK